jgi:RNA polymerase sigma-70 factor (ECF subfamily)
MPPATTWYRRADIPDFLRVGPLSGEWRWRHVPTRANGQLAVGCYTWDEASSSYLPFCVDVLTLEGERIKEVTAFIVRTPELETADEFRRWPDQAPDAPRVHAVFDRFGLPSRLD